MDTKKLRQKILDLAIHGKLVPQDPNDEPASVLLERIKAEKERLIKEGKIKCTKKSAKTSDTPHYENVPFEIPENWVWATLGEIFTLQAGKNITAKDISAKQDADYRYPCYGGNGLRGYVSFYNKEGRFPLIGRQGALCGNVNDANGKFYATEHAVVVNTYCNTNVYWVINTLLYLNLNQYATSTAQPGLSVSTINEVMIPVPPLKEQQRISNSIKSWFSLIDQLEQGKSDLQTAIKQAKSKILVLAIHGKLVPQDPNDESASELLKRINPKAEITCDNGHYPLGWCKTQLKYIADYVNGRAFKPEEWETNGLPIVRIQNLNDETAPYNKSSKSYEEKYLIHKGDLLFAWAASLGTYVWEKGDAWLNQHIFKVIPFVFMDKLYLYYSLESLIKDFYKESHGSGIVHITKKKFEDIECFVPPLAEQQRIVAKIEELFSILDSIQKSLEAW